MRVDGQLLLDPSTSEQARADGGLLMALMPSSNEVTQMSVSGGWGGAPCRQAMELAMGGCGQLKEAMRGALLEGLAKTT